MKRDTLSFCDEFRLLRSLRRQESPKDEGTTMKKVCILAVLLSLFSGQVGRGDSQETQAENSPRAERLPWRIYVTNCIETLIRDGTDRYGPIHTDMLTSILDVKTHE